MACWGYSAGSEDSTLRVPTPADLNAEQIGKLQAKVARLEGALAALAKRASDLIKERDDALPPIRYYGEIQGHRFIAYTSGHRFLCEYCGQWITLTAVEGECSGGIKTEQGGVVVTGFPPWEDGKDGNVPGGR